ncbi:MAG: CvpA family protein [Lachnospiraceae bacterium]|nr:CvpA family protein [Lachnospiraceae bacterium]
MNWLMIVILIIFLIFVIRGWRRGLLKMLFSVISIVILIALVAWATPHISTLIRENTGIYTAIENRCTEAIQSRVESSLENGLESGLESGSESGPKSGPEINSENSPESGSENNADRSSDSTGVSLPETITSYITGSGENAIAESGVYETMGSKAADWILAGASFLIALLLAILVVRIIGHALGIVNHIPILGGINRVLGLFAGGFEAFVLVSLLFLFVALIAGTGTGSTITAYIDENALLSYWYDHNVLLNLGILS